MRPSIRITLIDDNETKFFGEGPCQLLKAVEQTGSLRAAAMSMEMAYSKATRLLKQAESSLGIPLTTRTTGGKDGGGSTLTPEARQWVAQYEAYRDACIQANQALFQKMFPRIGCVIMASGSGKRFGSNKLMADFDGEPMIARALAATEGLFDNRVVVTRHESVADLCRQKGIRVVLHDLPYRSDTVRLGLEALGDLQGCLFCPGDQPLLRRETVAALLAAWKAEPDSILRPVSGGSEGSPVLFPAWAFPELLSLPEGKGGNWVAKNHPHRVKTLTVANPWELTDADTPEILETLKGLCHDQKD